MSDNHLFPSPDLSSIFKKKNDSNQIKLQPARRNYHMNSQKLARKEQEINIQANNYRRMMSYSSLKFRNAISNSKMFLTPEKPITSPLWFSIVPQTIKKGIQIFQNYKQKNLYQKYLLEKNVEEQMPLVFIKGKINLEVNYEDELGKLSMRKIVNHSQFNFTNVSCLVIATPQKISKNSIFLPPDKYEIVMAEYLGEVIQSRSSTATIELIGKWVQPTYRYLSVILRDEDTQDILFCTYCYSFKDLVESVTKKEKISQKVY